MLGCRFVAYNDALLRQYAAQDEQDVEGVAFSAKVRNIFDVECKKRIVGSLNFSLGLPSYEGRQPLSLMQGNSIAQTHSKRVVSSGMSALKING